MKIRLLLQVWNEIMKQGELLMTMKEALDQVNQKLSQLSTDVAEVKTRVPADIQALRDQLKAALDQVTAGQGVTADDITAMGATVDRIDTVVKGIDVPEAPPAAAVTA